MVDMLYFEGDTLSLIARAIKTAYAVNEIGVFAMTGKGLKASATRPVIFEPAR
jgi:predicted ATP-dependent serine protease